MKLKKKKYTFLDPVHQNIELDLSIAEEKLIFELIETTEFQRLRRIRQLGFSYLTFYGAESTRFVHSIGAFHVARLMLNQLESKHKTLVAKHRTAVLVAALLHDIGHGPFSHSSEPAFGFRHEEWTQRIILEDTEINKVLKKFDKTLPKKVINIFSENISSRNRIPSWCNQIISGQLDCDRADYLIRDSHQTGTTYGIFQLKRVIQSLRLHKTANDVKLVVSEKGINAVEDYLFARYSMYLQVYHHRKTLSADALFSSLISRAKFLFKKDLKVKGRNIEIFQALQSWMNPENDSISLEDFWEVDDACMLQHIKDWARNSSDSILKNLSQRIINRDLLKTIKFKKLNKQEIKKIQSKFTKEEAKHFCLVHECKEFPYNDRKKPILILQENQKITELSKLSSIASSLINKNKELDIKWLFFAE